MGFPLAALAGPLIAGAFGAHGQSQTNAASAAEAQRNRDFEMQEAQKNRDFQQSMSNTEIQRRIADLKAAGLNPALAYGQGGASAPSGSTASGSMANFDSSAGAGISSAASVGTFMQSAATQSTQREAIQAQADLTKAQAYRTNLLADAELGELKQRTRGHSAQSSVKEAEYVRENALFPYRRRLLEAQAESGFSSAREARERTRLYEPQRKLFEYQIPMARNISEAADSFLLKNIAPYLGSAAALKNLMNPFK